MKTSRKLLVLVLALVMVFACAVPAMAAYVRQGTYDQAASSSAPTVTGEFTVTLNIVSDTVDYYVINRPNLTVSLGSSGDPAPHVYTVADVLAAAASQYSWLYIYKNANLDQFTNTSTFVYGVKDTAQGTMVFAPNFSLLTKFRGWVYKINGQYPLLDSSDIPNDHDVSTEGPCCAKVNEAYVKANDIIDLYFCDSTASETTATRTMWITNSSYSTATSTLTLDVCSAYSWDEEIVVDEEYYWHVTDDDKYSYQPMPYQKVRLTIDNSSSWLYINNGTITKSSVTLAPGEHTIRIGTVFTTAYDFGGIDYLFPKYLGTVYKLTVPSGN